MGGDGGDGSDGSVGGGGSASASIGDTGGGGSISGDAGSIGGGGTASAGDTGGLSADDSEGPGEGVGSSIAAAALSAQADAQAAMGNLGFGAVGADLSGPSANLASPQDAINDAFGQFGYAPTTTSQQDEAATYGMISNTQSFNLPTAPAVPAPTAPTPAELGTPTAPPGMTDEEAAAAQNSMQGLFGIAPAPAPAPSPFGQLASFEGPNATVSGKSATSAQDAADALSDEQDSIAAQNIAAFNLAQQEQEAKALDQQFNPQPTPVPTVAVAPEDMPTAPLNQDVDPAQTIADQAKEAKAAVQAIDNALAAPLGKGGIGADATAAPGPATAADLSDAVTAALGTLSPTAAEPSLGEQGKAALAAAMNNALGQFGPPAPAPSISAVTGFTAPPGPPSMQGFAPPGIPGNLGLNLPNTPPAPSAALPGPATSIGTPAVAASFQGFSTSPPGVVGVAAPVTSQEADPASLAARSPVAPPPAPPAAMISPPPTSMAINPQTPTPVPSTLTSPTQQQIDAAKQALVGQQNQPAPFGPPAPNTLGTVPSGVVGSLPGITATSPTVGPPSSLSTAHGPIGPAPSSFSMPPSGTIGTLGSNISGFTAGSGLGNFAAAAAQTGPVAAQAVSVGFPPTAAIAMQALFNTPLRA